jgi:hypothetical protein
MPGEGLRQTMRASTQDSLPQATPQPTNPIENFPTQSPQPTATVTAPLITPRYTQHPVIYDPGEFYDTTYARALLDGGGTFGVEPGDQLLQPFLRVATCHTDRSC